MTGSKNEGDDTLPNLNYYEDDREFIEDDEIHTDDMLRVPDGAPTLFYQPPTVGGYHVGDNVQIMLLKKPRWLHRKMMQWAFGWEWRDG